jgi:hypothetical protein
MKSPHWFVLLLISFAALPAQAELSVRLEVDPKEPTVRYDGGLPVVLKNESDQAIKIWDLETKRGQGQISLEFVDPKNGKLWVARWREITDDEYWTLVSRRRKSRSAVIEIAPRGETRFSIVLHNFAWGQRAWVGMPSPNVEVPYQVTVRFANADNRQPGIWSGAIQSEAVSARFVAPWIRTVHDYLHDRFPDKAIELMAADKKLIDGID